MTLADQQARDRIEHSLGETLFVEAGAGTGKTHQLVQRIVNLIATGVVQANEIAAITFTEKGAAELYDRVLEELDQQRQSTTDPARSALFAANCASCHGDTGAGDGPLADSLPAPPANFTIHVPFHPDGVLYAWITDGIRGTGMPGWSPQLSDQERWDLVNFLRANFDPAAAQ